ncbi:amine oxidase [Streptomyces sp. NBRC 110611]|uniref:FAD-dependent oxidoreductase n=1 Tax=Streptomyces sp. NBRC 110611 TaxID=1621259 RepID=UPI00083313D4|nr:FAD-dependent oxidoreductase [Streptomyces sp. NBRC 110611]GAU69135.1 amine oxidase [Streptomyces sp. NBRC 110611]
MGERIAIVGAGVSGLAAAWALTRHPGQYDVQVYERGPTVGGNAQTADFPQKDGGTAPADIAVTAFIPSVYQNYVELLHRLGIETVDTRFSYAVQYGDEVYAHDTDTPLRQRLAGDIARFRRMLRVIGRLNVLNSRPSLTLAASNPFNYLTMRRALDVWGISQEFRYKLLKPLFVNFVLTSGVFEMPASMFVRYMDFFDIERSTPMVTWHGGTRAVYRALTRDFTDRIRTDCAVTGVTRRTDGVLVEAAGTTQRFDQVIFACNANHALALLRPPSARERRLLGAVRYDAGLHREAVVHTDDSLLPDDALRISGSRSTFVRQYGDLPDNYEVTYIMHNQQPWGDGAASPCLVTYNAQRPPAPEKTLGRHRFQHVMHDLRHTVALHPLLPLLQGRRRTWYCGAHMTINSQEHAFLSGLAVARQLGADYPFPENREATRWFNFYGRMCLGARFRRVR